MLVIHGLCAALSVPRFFDDTSPADDSPLSLHDALPILRVMPAGAHLTSIEFSAANAAIARRIWEHAGVADRVTVVVGDRSEEHTSELQSRLHLVCRLLLEKKKRQSSCPPYTKVPD